VVNEPGGLFNDGAPRARAIFFFRRAFPPPRVADFSLDFVFQ